VPTTELSHGYSGVELEENLQVIRHLFAAQATLLKVNQEYIRSAAQADAFRTEPPFKLQGSYRNMNKIAEKVVSAMTPDEVENLVGDHYQGESQTLTTAAEQNLLKLAELRGRMTPAQQARWNEIKAEFVRQRRMGGGDDDPVTRLVGTLSGLGAELGAIKSALGSVGGSAELGKEMRELRGAITLWAKQASADAATRDPEDWLAPRLDTLAESLRARPNGNGGGNGNGDHAAPAASAAELLAQVRRIEETLVPVVGAAVEQRAGDQALALKMVQIIELLEQLDARLGGTNR
jgi:hypothetical protein